MLRRHPWLFAVGTIVLAAFLVTFGVLVISDSSTAPLAIVFVPLYAFGAILLLRFARSSFASRARRVTSARTTGASSRAAAGVTESRAFRDASVSGSDPVTEV